MYFSAIKDCALDLTSLLTELLRLAEVISAQWIEVNVFEFCIRGISIGKQNLLLVLKNVCASCKRTNRVSVLMNSIVICISVAVYGTLEYRSRKVEKRTSHTPHPSYLNRRESCLHFQELCDMVQRNRKANFCLPDPPLRAYSTECSAQSWSRAVCPRELVPIFCNDKSPICTKGIETSSSRGLSSPYVIDHASQVLHSDRLGDIDIHASVLRAGPRF